MLLGSRNRHIEQSALFFELPHRISTHRAGEYILFEPHDKHRRELQTFCRVNRHQRHLIVRVALVAVEVGQQSHFLQEVGQIDLVAHILLLATLHKILHAREKFLEVLLSGYILWIATAVDVAADARVHDDIMTQRVGILRVLPSDPAFYQLAEVLKLRHRTFRDIHREQHGLLDHLPQTYTVCLCRLDNLAYGRIADTASRIVDNTLEGFFIVGIGNQPEIGNHILDLLALIEAQATIDAIRNAVLAHLLLKRTALRVRAIKNSEVSPRAMILPSDALDVLRHNHRLLLVRIGWLQLQLLSVLIA